MWPIFDNLCKTIIAILTAMLNLEQKPPNRFQLARENFHSEEEEEAVSSWAKRDFLYFSTPEAGS